ncbi:MAG: hypothetical protein GXP55_10805 [Deltaproteobacteria bacterium]|nr:hypothetical protein [Deltaproteobacteria bacterium]
MNFNFPAMSWVLVPLLAVGCALPRAGTNRDGSVTGLDSSVDAEVFVDSGPICETPDCNDGKPCTDDLCTATGCKHVPNTDPCDNGVFCDGFDTCADGDCQAGDGDPCVAPTVCNEPRRACLGCNDDSDCPMANVPEWSTCDFGGSPCELSGTHARTVTSFSCDLVTHECQSTTTPESEACTRPATDTNGASCAVGASSGRCQSGSCCTGCLGGNRCRGGTSDGRCGRGGMMCSSCGGATPYCTGVGSCVECVRDGQCGDGNGNTTDRCTGNVCVHVCTGCVSGGSCVAGDSTSACGTSGRACSSCGSGSPFCVGSACVECRNGGDCDDGNPCTDDSCTGGSCVHANNTASCNDGNRCTLSDRCVSGSCQAGAAKNCDDGEVCTTDSCDPSSGACGHLPNTAACDDGDACTLSDRCSGGRCQPGSPKNCDDTNVCTTDSCNSSSGACGYSNNSRSCTGGVCGGGSCCTGCLSAGTCLAGDTPSACGAAGSSCQPCSGGTPFCVSGGCAECEVDANCTSATKAACVSGSCAPCANTADCASVSGLPACDTGASPNTCVECLDDTNCGGGTPRCNTTTQVCVECLVNADCGGSTSFCKPSTNICVECLNNGDCGPGSMCSASNTCS